MISGPTPAAPARSLLGRTVGKYVVERLLGSGGMGSVYLASDPLLQRPVAIKLLSPEMLGMETGRERFFREARAIARLSHPNVVRIYEAVDDPQQPFLAMEYVEGSDARSLLASPPSLEQALEVMAQVFDGLAVAHESGVVHRDVKPANVLLAADGTVKLIDFGLARVAGDERDLTRGQVFGTASYMSPEQIMEPGTIDARTDIYAAGALLYQLVTGVPPFSGPTVAETLLQIVNEPPPELTELAPGCPPDVADLVRRCLAKDRNDRPSSAREVAAELRRLAVRLQEPRPTPPPLPPPGPPRRRSSSALAVLLAAGVATVILGIAAGVVVALRRPPGPGATPGPTPAAGPVERARLVALDPPPGTTRIDVADGESFTFRVGVGGAAATPQWRLNDAPVSQGMDYVYTAGQRGHRDLVSVSVGGGEGPGTILVWYVTVP